MSEVLGALLLNDLLECSIVAINAREVVTHTVDSLLHIIACLHDTVLVLVAVALPQADQVAIEDAHVLVLDALLAHLHLVGVGHGVVHPLVLEAGGGCILHCLSAHVLQGSGEDGVDLVRLVEGDVGGGLAWILFVVLGRVLVARLAVLLLDHILQDLGAELGLGSHYFL